MKMNYLLLIVACMFLASVQVGFAQCLWTEASGDIYRNTGKVGIGTTSPNALIEARSADGTANHITAIISNDSEEGDALLEFQEFEGGDRGRIGSITSSSPNRFVINPTGNVDTTINEGGGKVGIGTSSPAGKLHVRGEDIIVGDVSYEARGRIFYQEVNGGYWGFSLVYNGDEDDWHDVPENHFGIVRHQDDTTGSAALVVSRFAGNVGIGTSNPQRTLHIKDVMRLEPQASAPSGGKGDLYAGTNGKLYFHNGTAWKEVVLQ